MNKHERLKKVKEKWEEKQKEMKENEWRVFVEVCVEANVCPLCGGELKIRGLIGQYSFCTNCRFEAATGIKKFWVRKEE